MFQKYFAKFCDILKKLAGFKRLNLFQKTFLSLVLVVVLPIVAMTIINYSVTKQNLEREVNMSNLDILRQTRMAMDSTLEATERMTLQIIGNSEIENFLESEIDISNYQHTKIIKTLNSTFETFMQGAQHVESISVSSFFNKIDVSTGGGMYRKMEDDEIANINKLYRFNKNKVWLVTEKGTTDNKDSTIQMIRFINTDKEYPQGVVRIKLKNNETTKLIQDLFIRKTGYILLLDENSKIIISGNRTPDEYSQDLNLDPQWFVQEDGYKQMVINEQTFLISYTTSRYNGWKYVAILPADELRSKAEVIRNIFLVICVIFMFFSALLSFAIAKGIYNPIFLIQSILKGEEPVKNRIEKLSSRGDELGEINNAISKIIAQLTKAKFVNESVTEEKNALKVQLDDNESRLKDYFLYRLICGDISNKQEILTQAVFLEIPYKAKFRVIIADFDKNYEDQTKHLDEEGKKAIKFGVLEIFEKTIARVAKPVKVFYEVVEAKERLLGIISVDESQRSEQDMYSLKVECSLFQNIILSSLRFTISISVGNIYNNLSEIRKSYEEAVQAIKYKFLLGSNVVIFKEELDKSSMEKSQQYSYKKHLKNSLDIGNKGEIRKLLMGFKTSLKIANTPSDECMYYLMDIINIMIEYLNDLGQGYSDNIKDLNSMFLEFNEKFEDIDEAIDWIYCFVETVLAKKDNNTGHKFSRLVEEAVKILEAEYQNDLSLSYVSDRLAVSDQYLSRIFRDEVGKNFKEYLTVYKMNKAKELLRNTDIPIQEIVGMVGYNNHSQFTRMFKRMEGITAVEYRGLAADEQPIN